MRPLDPLLYGAEAVYEKLLERRRQKWTSQPAECVAGCKIISVGNITVGGTGKTPTVQFIANELRRARARVAVIARGYRGRLSESGAVVSDGKAVLLGAHEAGDEPLLHARALPGVPVLIGRDRVAAVRRAVAQFGVDTVVLDDAFQFWSLARDLDIVLLDARRPFDNGHLLPRGRLRERPDSLRRADAIVITRCDVASEEQRMTTGARVRELTDAPVWETRHAPVTLKERDGTVRDLAALEGVPIAVFSALADNAAFADSLRARGAKIVSQVGRPDHHFWREGEIENVIKEAMRCGAEFVVTTEKDAVKLSQRKFELPIFSVRIELQFLFDEEGFRRLLFDKLSLKTT